MDYQNGKIYTIRSYQTEKYYIGSTVSTLTKRLSGHKTTSTNKQTTAKIITDLGDAYIELLELYPCNSKIELMKREGELQRLYKNDIVNKRVECRTGQEYYMDNVNKILENQKQYRKSNIEKIKVRKQGYYKNNADIILEKCKEHYKKNADKLKVYQQEYRKNNANKIIERTQENYKENADEINKKRREKYQQKKLKLKTII
jgi:wobble nucleotide-excising tRNase